MAAVMLGLRDISEAKSVADSHYRNILTVSWLSGKVAMTQGQ